MQNLKQISIQYFAILREQANKHHELFETTAQTAEEVYAQLRQRYDFSLMPSQVKLAVNEQFEAMSYEIKPGDNLVFIPPVSGG